MRMTESELLSEDGAYGGKANLPEGGPEAQPRVRMLFSAWRRPALVHDLSGAVPWQNRAMLHEPL